MMPYPAFLLRQHAGALRQLLLAGAVSLGQMDDEHAAMPLAQLRDAAGV